MLGGAPVRCDVPGSVQVRMFRVLALLAHESFAARTVLPGRVPALGATLRSVPRVHVHHGHPVLRGLVRHHVLLPSERPGVQSPSGIHSEAGTSQSNVRQVFQRQRCAARKLIQDVLRDVVVAPEPKPLPLPDALPEEALCGTCAFSLETALRPEVSTVHLMPVGIADDLAVRERSRDHNATITTDHVSGNLGGFDLLVEGEGEPPVALGIAREFSAIAGPPVVTLQPEVFANGYPESLAERCQGHLHPVGSEGHGVCVKRDGQQLGGGARRLLALLDALPDGSNGTHGEAHDVANELGLEAVLGSEPVVRLVVEMDGALDLGIDEGDGGGVVVGGGDTSLQVEQGRLGFCRDVEPDSNSSCHHRHHVVGRCIMSVNKKGALLLSLKEEVSARLLKNGKVKDQ